MTSRTKTAALPPPTRAEMEAAVAELNLLKTVEQNLESEKSAAIQAASVPFDEKLKVNVTGQLEAFQVALRWATANPQEFAKVKSLSTPNGTVGFRTGQPTVKPLKGRSFDPIVDFLCGTKRLFKKYVRTELSIDKEAIIRDRLRLKRLLKIGVKVVQEETFFVKTTIENVEPTVKGEAA